MLERRGLKVFFRDELADLLMALASAGAHRGPAYRAALADVARGCGLHGLAADLDPLDGEGTSRGQAVALPEVIDAGAWHREGVIIYQDSGQ